MTFGDGTPSSTYGQGEFYLEYGSFDVSLSVPANMIVAATGTLRNPAEVLTATQRARLARARKSDSTVVIRGLDEVGDPASRPAVARPARSPGDLPPTACAISPGPRRGISSGTRSGVNGGKTLAMSFYPPSAEPLWNQSTQYVRFAVDNYSSWYRYPYPVAINVNGIEGGMEYPMIVFCHNRTDPQALFSVTDHEIGHTWFPMIVGNNERLYPWMDEGFNTFMNRYNWDKKYPGAYNRRGDPGPLRSPWRLSGKEESIMTPADRIAWKSSAPTAYTSRPRADPPRDLIIGPERFDPAFKEYITPVGLQAPDAGRLLSQHRGRRRRGPELVLALLVLHHGDAGPGGGLGGVGLRQRRVPDLPAECRRHADAGGARAGDGRRHHEAAELAGGGLVSMGTATTVLVPGPKKVVRVTIDPKKLYPDVRRENNVWVDTGDSRGNERQRG